MKLRGFQAELRGFSVNCSEFILYLRGFHQDVWSKLEDLSYSCLRFGKSKGFQFSRALLTLS